MTHMLAALDGTALAHLDVHGSLNMEDAVVLAERAPQAAIVFLEGELYRPAQDNLPHVESR